MTHLLSAQRSASGAPAKGLHRKATLVGGPWMPKLDSNLISPAQQRSKEKDCIEYPSSEKDQTLVDQGISTTELLSQ
jgi:hypothetical protein